MTVAGAIIWAIPYLYALSACVHGLHSAKAERIAVNPSLPLRERRSAEERRYSSRQRAVALGLIAVGTSIIFMIFESV